MSSARTRADSASLASVAASVMPSRFLRFVFLLVPLSTWAAPVRGIDAYARGNYPQAITALSQEVDNPALSDKERARALLYLAASMHALGRADQTRERLEELVRRFPEQRVDPARFPPDFVALADLARQTVETERLREQARAQEAERLRLLEEQARTREETPPDPLEPPAEKPPAALAESSFRVRPELVGFSDLGGLFAPAALRGRASLGMSLGVTVSIGGPEAGLRLLPAPDARFGLALEAGYAFGQSALQPRVALRGTLVRSVGAGGGALVGVRYTPLRRLTLLADAGVEGFWIRTGNFHPLVVTASVGMGINLF